MRVEGRGESRGLFLWARSGTLDGAGPIYPGVAGMGGKRTLRIPMINNSSVRWGRSIRELAMRLALMFLTSSLLVGCGQSASEVASNNSEDLQAAANSGPSASTTVPNELPLAPGLYEVSVVESIAAVGTSPERRNQQCVDAAMAAHPETFVNPGSLPGCVGSTPLRDGMEVRSELRCADNHVLSISTTLRSDGWEQTVSGVSLDGTYESRETAHRIGDC